MTKDEILTEQTDVGLIEDIYEVLFEKLETEYENFKDRLINMNVINALDMFSEEYSAVIQILTLYSDFVENVLTDPMAETLVNIPDLLHKLAVQYNENMQYLTENDWYDLWYGIFTDVIQNSKAEPV